MDFCVLYAEIPLTEFEAFPNLWCLFFIFYSLKNLFSRIGRQESQLEELNMLALHLREVSSHDINIAIQQKMNELNDTWKKLSERVNGTPDLDENLSGRTTDSDHNNSVDVELHNSQEELHLKYQLLYSEYFDWISSCEENLAKLLIGENIIRALQVRVKSFLNRTLNEENNIDLKGIF